MNSRLVLFIVIIFILLIFMTVYDFYKVVLIRYGETGSAIASTIINGLWFILTSYGSLVGIVIGFSSIASEMYGNTLNTLIVKPLYRDNIINGKLIGAIGFLICVFGLAIALFTSAMFVVAGNSFYPVFFEYIYSIPTLFTFPSYMYWSFSPLQCYCLSCSGVRLSR